MWGSHRDGHSTNLLASYVPVDSALVGIQYTYNQLHMYIEVSPAEIHNSTHGNLTFLNRVT
jgi:hypothetical protein